MKIDCGTCRMRGNACGHCMMSVLLGPVDNGRHRSTASTGPVRVAASDAHRASEPNGLLDPFDPDDLFDLTDDERAAVSALSAGGLIPPSQPVFAGPIPVHLVPLRRCGPAA